MANTLIPIQTYTLTSTASSVTFSNIPQNYTDLKVVVSARSDTSRASNGFLFDVRPNGSSSNMTRKSVYGDGSTVASSSGTEGYNMALNPSDYTASTFSNTELYITNYTSSNYKSMSTDTVAENNATTTLTLLGVMLWSSTSAITSLVFTPFAGNFVSGSTFTLYGISNGVKATGGTLTVAGGYAYHTFTSTGSFLPNQKIKGAEVLCIAGGGGGGSNVGGAGGAGGLLYAPAQTLNAGNTYTALIGSGGSGGSGTSSGRNKGTSGTNSVFSSLTAIGGGGGGSNNANGTDYNGQTGGSGGGAAAEFNGTGGTPTSGQGYAGGTGTNIGSRNDGGGGGGGAGGVGGNASSTFGGSGGIGSNAYALWATTTNTGVNGYYAGGGGGGAGYTDGLGGLGGGGYGGNGVGGSAGSGTANTGGGGGSGSWSYGSGAAGGSGLIIVRYPLS